MGKLKKGTKLVFITNCPLDKQEMLSYLTEWDKMMLWNGMVQFFIVGENRQKDTELFMELAKTNCERYLHIVNDEDLIDLAKRIFSQSNSNGYGNNRLFTAIERGLIE